MPWARGEAWGEGAEYFWEVEDWWSGGEGSEAKVELGSSPSHQSESNNQFV